MGRAEVWELNLVEHLLLKSGTHGAFEEEKDVVQDAGTNNRKPLAPEQSVEEEHAALEPVHPSSLGTTLHL